MQKMSHALAYRCDDPDSDLNQIANLTVDCYRCDPDNPLAVPDPSKCPECKGTRRAPVHYAQILSEIRESHAEQEKQMSAEGSEDDSGEVLEDYSDEDDTFVD
jgi:hypothetical protein